MIREEYLNIEFMYRFINSLCKRDGYHLTDFEFGKLYYRLPDVTPVVMKNNNGYNMVYKFRVYKLPKKLNLRTSTVHLSFPGENEIDNNIIEKTFCFDLSSECIVEYDKKNCHFTPYPSFFRLDNQLYYSIYNQPKVLSYHYSPGRDAERIPEYIEYMGIDCYNIFSFDTILKNSGEKVRWVSGCGYCIFYDDSQEANERVLKALTKSHDCVSWRLPVKDYRLCIHKANVPVFYTDNVLELTIPLAEDIKKLSANMERSLRHINYCMNLMSNSIQGLMDSRLRDIEHHFVLEKRYAKRVMHCADLSIENFEAKHKQEKESIKSRYSGNIDFIKENIANIGNSCDFYLGSSELYGRIIQNIKNLNSDSDTFSIDGLVSLAKDLDLLNQQINELPNQ